uniref:Gluconokinase n=1 Tax=Strongyloides papillosus TaxID=174720 RepID=A0A0N5BRU4_STREA
MSGLNEFIEGKKHNYIIVVMGVSGSGKTTIGEYLSHHLNFLFVEGDNYHSSSNKEKMKLGVPLNDEDRLPWLKSINEKLQFEFFKNNRSIVLACSSLKKKYRDILKDGFSVNDFIFIYLDIEENEIKRRLEERKGHFFNPVLIKSQFNSLEEPSEGEGKGVIKLSLNHSINILMERIISLLP